MDSLQSNLSHVSICPVCPCDLLHRCEVSPHSPGDGWQCDELSRLHGCIQAVCPHGLHSDDRDVVPAGTAQALHHTVKETPTPDGQHNRPRLLVHLRLKLLHQGRVTLPVNTDNNSS